MKSSSAAAVLGLAYICGLLSTTVLGYPAREAAWWQWIGLSLGIAICGVLVAKFIHRFWRTGPRKKVWLLAGLIAALAVVYFWLRIPQPVKNDVSRYVENAPEQVTIQGEILTEPRLTRSDRAFFWFQATQLNENESVSGKLYVTLPLLQATGLYPGQNLAVSGRLYQPNPAPNPGAFDFSAYLAREGAFAGLSGYEVILPETEVKPPWGWWKLRQRIIRAQIRWLGSPKGQLVSSMVLGRRAVDLPYDLRDRFVKAGLAHVLAASGFHVSLLLGVVLGLTARFSAKTQFVVGAITLFIYVGLTGLQASVMRAALMGFGALFALVVGKKRKPLGLLLLAAIVLLLFNPFWIRDLGFQLSFLATLGLIVTVPVVTKWLDWLPPAIAALFTVPIAASLWTLPLVIYVFHVVAPYTIPANIAAMPLVAIVSLGGFLSAFVAIVFPIAGSTLAELLNYPSEWLISIVEYFTNLPNSSFAVGKISLFSLIALYGLLALVWWNKKWQRRWWLVTLMALLLLIVPFWFRQATLFQLTLLATENEPVLVIQDRRAVTLINSGDLETAQYTVLPFLRQQGINQLDWAVALDVQSPEESGWQLILSELPVTNFLYNTVAGQKPLPEDNPIATAIPAQTLETGSSVLLKRNLIRLISSEPPVLELQLGKQTWLLVGESQYTKPEQLAEQLQSARSLMQTLDKQNLDLKVLLFSGNNIRLDWLETLQPKIAIASTRNIDPHIVQTLSENKIKFYLTSRDGAIQWTPGGGFQTTHSIVDRDASFF
ncbi:MAG: ComEC/Rec2 family competence protein [Oscillatoria sp. PMC 1051.18]|nr:ComEC/Rec2 family competence protein [Oscillatoria sp. PMC 1050.18]MEC5028443.1 ComEC/Rec2 family competence protein [Oscillatoria sp. PMC 1051.18]